MNIPLRNAYKANSWSRPHGFLEYLRGLNCFQSVTDKPNANPYWYGTKLDFNRLEAVVRQAVQDKSIKLSRLKEFADSYAEDYLSPIVRLTGLVLQTMVKKLSQ